MKRWLLLTLLCVPCWATIARVGSGAGSDCAAATTCAVTYSPTSGNFVLVEILFNTSGTPITSVTDNGSGGSSTYASSYNATCGGYECALFTTCNVKAGVTTITANLPSSDTAGVQVFEYSGIATSSCQDQVSTQATGTGTTQTAGTTGTTTNASDLIIGGFHNNDTTASFTGSVPYTTLRNQGCASCGGAIGMVDQIVSSTGTYAATATQGLSVTWSGYTVAFKGAAAAPPSTPAIAVNTSNILLKPGTQITPGTQIRH